MIPGGVSRRNVDALYSLLIDLCRLENIEPEEIDLSEMDGHAKIAMLIGCCCELIASCIMATAANRTDALHAFKAAIDTIRHEIERTTNDHQRLN